MYELICYNILYNNNLFKTNYCNNNIILINIKGII